jgi:hypothetical protein
MDRNSKQRDWLYNLISKMVSTTLQMRSRRLYTWLATLTYNTNQQKESRESKQVKSAAQS